MAAIVANSSGETFGCRAFNMRRIHCQCELGRVLRLACIRTSREKGTRMRHLLIRVTLAVTATAIVSPVLAQVPPPAAAPPQWSPPAYSGNTYHPYQLSAPTPRDAYRDGTINRWQLEQLEGPLPQALQGPSPDGNRGGDGGGGGDRGS
jgi:hypothetical protein